MLASTTDSTDRTPPGDVKDLQAQGGWADPKTIFKHYRLLDEERHLDGGRGDGSRDALQELLEAPARSRGDRDTLWVPPLHGGAVLVREKVDLVQGDHLGDAPGSDLLEDTSNRSDLRIERRS